MDTKNVIAAISLSAAVIILYSLFFVEPVDPNKIKKEPIEKTKIIESSDAPALDQNENLSRLTRKEALAESDRISFENDNIVGTINTMGATIDDLTFKNYNFELYKQAWVKLMDDVIEKHGGHILNYIGDAIMVVYGAPN